MNNLILPQRKLVRATVIKQYVREAGYNGVVCFSCGNASRELIKVGLDVLDISKFGPLAANNWWTPAHIHKIWPHLFDATSGHLPMGLMVQLAIYWRCELKLKDFDTYLVPTGSGETITCLNMAFPLVRFTPVSEGTPATRWDTENKLLALITTNQSQNENTPRPDTGNP